MSTKENADLVVLDLAHIKDGLGEARVAEFEAVEEGLGPLGQAVVLVGIPEKAHFEFPGPRRRFLEPLPVLLGPDVDSRLDPVGNLNRMVLR